MRRAAAFGLPGRGNVTPALAGFMVRGSVLLLAVPGAVLPSVLGLAAAIGVNAFAIDGRPTTAFFELVAVVSAVAATWLLAAAFVGSIIDVWLVEAALQSRAAAPDRARPLPTLDRLLSLAGIRAVCLVPLAVPLTWAGSRIYTSAFSELTNPSNLSEPLVFRIVLGATDAVAVVLACWLIEETIAAVAVRRQIMTNCGVARAIVGALDQLVRRPITSIAAVLLPLAASTAMLAGGMALVATAFEWCLAAARVQQPIAITLGIGSFTTTRDFRPIVFVGAALVMALAWVAASLLAGVAAAWRSAALTLEVADATADRADEASESALGLSGREAATSGH